MVDVFVGLDWGASFFWKFCGRLAGSGIRHALVHVAFAGLGEGKLIRMSWASDRNSMEGDPGFASWVDVGSISGRVFERSTSARSLARSMVRKPSSRKPRTLGKIHELHSLPLLRVLLSLQRRVRVRVRLPLHLSCGPAPEEHSFQFRKVLLAERGP